MVDKSETDELDPFLPSGLNNESSMAGFSGKVDVASTLVVLPVSRRALLIVAIYLTFVGLSSTIGNSMFLMVLRRRLRSICDGQTILLLNTALCDLGISITGYPYTTISAYFGEWMFGDVMCQVYGFLCFTLNEVQMNTLVVIAVFRYVTVCRPQFNHLLTNDLAKRCLIFVWLFSLLWTAPPLFGWSSYTFEPFSVSCSTDWHDRSFSGISYSICLVIFCYLLQVAILAVCYYKILSKSRELQVRPPETNPKIYAQEEDQDLETPGLKCCYNYVCVCESNFKNGIEKHVLMMNVLMVVSFIVFWTPYAVVSLISIFKTDLQVFWYIFPTVFAKTSCMMNPIIYGLSHKLLRRELIRFMKATCCSDEEDLKRQLNESRLRAAEGTYDKEGIYVGKVKVGLCACNGCVIGRRETLHAQMAVLARLQKSPVSRSVSNEEQNEINRLNTCAITLVDDSPPSNGGQTTINQSNGKGKQEKDDDDMSMVEVIMNPKVWSSSNFHQQQQTQHQQDQQDTGFNESQKKGTTESSPPEHNSSQKHKKSAKDDGEEKSLEISVTARIRKNTTFVSDNSAASFEDEIRNSIQETVIETTTTSAITNTISQINM